MQQRLPQSWIAPGHILDLRAKVRLRKTLVDQRTEWLQRIHAILFHHGVPVQPGRLARLEGEHAREQLADLDLPAIAQQQITVALGIIEHLNGVLHDLDLELERFARRQAGCKALMGHYGIGPCVATAILAELGDVPGASPPHDRPCAAPAWTSPSMKLTRAGAPGTSRARAPRYCAGQPSKPPNRRRARDHLTTSTTCSSRRDSGPTARR